MPGRHITRDIRQFSRESSFHGCSKSKIERVSGQCSLGFSEALASNYARVFSKFAIFRGLLYVNFKNTRQRCRFCANASVPAIRRPLPLSFLLRGSPLKVWRADLSAAAACVPCCRRRLSGKRRRSNGFFEFVGLIQILFRRLLFGLRNCEKQSSRSGPSFSP